MVKSCPGDLEVLGYMGSVLQIHVAHTIASKQPTIHALLAKLVLCPVAGANICENIEGTRHTSKV